MKRLGMVLLGLVMVAARAVAAGPSVPATAGCVLEREDHYLCNREAFVAKFHAASTVRIETARMDAYGAKQMQEVLEGLGKMVAAPEQRPDLVVELSWIDRSGRIDIGPSDISLAFLRVYEPATGGGRHMVWAQTWDGQDERPWPAIAGDLIREFHDVVAPKR